jgi:hypothetical protein
MRVPLISRWLAIAALALAPGCSRDSGRSPTSPTSAASIHLEDIAASASTADTSGVRRSGTPPAGGGGPRVSAAANHTVINGGTSLVALEADAPFGAVYMYVGAKTMGVLGEFAGGIDGYYEIRLPSAQTSAAVLLTFPQNIPLDQFDLEFAVADASGAVGPYTALSTTVTRVGTGDVQVTLSWDKDADIDLHVIAPGGDEIFWGHREGSGGKLDLDSNAGCDIDGVRNENITWPTGRAPRGQYTVRVDYWSSCGVPQTKYTVRVNNGGSVQVVEGSFTGFGDQGGPGAGRAVASFERLSGPAGVTVSQTPGVTSEFSKKLLVPPPGR